DALFRFGSAPDYKDATQEIAVVDQAGLGLPDRDYYLKDDPKSVELRKQYVEHVQHLFALLGDAPPDAAANAKVVMDLETALARASLERVKRREPANVYHPTSRQELLAEAPSFPWEGYFSEIHAPAFDKLNVAVPDFVKAVEVQLGVVPIESWRT